MSKSHIRIESYGTVDELNAYIGLIRSQELDVKFQVTLQEIQDRLFTIGASLAADPERSKMKIPDLKDTDIQLLENEIDNMSASLPALKHFVLPGGSNAVSFLHIARCICRKAERLTVALSETSFVDELVIQYLNRLSDYLFVASRMMAQEQQVKEFIWTPRM